MIKKKQVDWTKPQLLEIARKEEKAKSEALAAKAKLLRNITLKSERSNILEEDDVSPITKRKEVAFCDDTKDKTTYGSWKLNYRH